MKVVLQILHLGKSLITKMQLIVSIQETDHAFNT